MAGFSLNDTISLIMRVVPHIRDIVDWWHRTSALLQKMGFISGPIAPAHAAHSYDVEWVQDSLNRIDRAGLQVDGEMGPATNAAVKQYQQKKGLDPDGWVGVLTMSALEQDMSAKKP